MTLIATRTPGTNCPVQSGSKSPVWDGPRNYVTLRHSLVPLGLTSSHGSRARRAGSSRRALPLAIGASGTRSEVGPGPDGRNLLAHGGGEQRASPDRHKILLRRDLRRSSREFGRAGRVSAEQGSSRLRESALLGNVPVA